MVTKGGLCKTYLPRQTTGHNETTEITCLGFLKALAGENNNRSLESGGNELLMLTHS